MPVGINNLKNTVINAAAVMLIAVIIQACGSRRTEVLAEFEGGTVDTARFGRAYSWFLESTRLKDSMTHRRMILNKIINEELILLEAAEDGLDRDPELLRKSEINRKQLMLNALSESEIGQPVDAPDSVLFAYYRLKNTYFDLHQLFTEDLAQAKTWAEDLRSGKTFDDLLPADLASDPSVNAHPGYIKYEDLVPEVRSALRTMKAGDVSDPVAGRYGYTVFSFSDRKETPLLTYQSFAEQKRVLRREYAGTVRSRSLEDYSADRLAELDLKWDDRALETLYGRMRPGSGILPSPVEDAELQGLVLGMSVEGEIIYGPLYALMEEGKSSLKRRIRDVPDLKKFLSGTVLRSRLLEIAAEKGLDETPEFREKLETSRKKLLLDTWMDREDAVRLQSQEKVDRFREAHPDLFIIPRMLHIRQYAGYPGAEPGEMIVDDLGWMRPDDLGEFRDGIFSAKAGETVGPFEKDGVNYSFEILDEMPEEIIPPELTQELIQSENMMAFRAEYLPLELDSLQMNYKVVKNEDLLKTLPYFGKNQEHE